MDWLPDIGPLDIGIEVVDPEAPASGVAGGAGDGTVVPGASVVVGFDAGGGAAGGVSGVCAKALGADASMAATALASAQRCRFVRVDMGGKAPFLQKPLSDRE